MITDDPLHRVIPILSPVRDTEMAGSYLVIVWYQDEFGPPTDDSTFSQIKVFDWNSVAADFHY